MEYYYIIELNIQLDREWETRHYSHLSIFNIIFSLRRDKYWRGGGSASAEYNIKKENIF